MNSQVVLRMTGRGAPIRGRGAIRGSRGNLLNYAVMFVYLSQLFLFCGQISFLLELFKGHIFRDRISFLYLVRAWYVK